MSTQIMFERILSIKVMCFIIMGSLISGSHRNAMAQVSGGVESKSKVEDVLLDDVDLANDLNLLIKKRNDIAVSGNSDPELGIKFIETITERQLSKYYETACEMYLWGFSGTDLYEHSNIIIEEANRILPLIENAEISEWEKSIKDKDFHLASLIRGFWIRNDPTPSTIYNERLIEHWERIIYARKSFRKNKNSVYRSDARGINYVKFGAPDRKKSGTFGSNNTELQLWLYEFGGVVKDKYTTQTLKLAEIEAMLPFPDYDIWIYDTVIPLDPLIFIYSYLEGRGYGEINSVDEIIPAKLFNTGRYAAAVVGSPVGMKPMSIGGLFQLLYYSNVQNFDSHFARRYRDLEAEWNSSVIGSAQGRAPHPSMLSSYKTRHVNADKNNPDKIDAPKVKTDIDHINAIEMIGEQLRLLDETNRPKLAVIAISFPEVKATVGLQNFLSGTTDNSEFTLTHSLASYDSDWNEVDKVSDTHSTNYDNTSVFVIDHQAASINHIISSNAEPKDQPETSQVHIGKKILEPSEPLSADQSTLEMSDLIAGTPTPSNILSTNYPFSVVPTKQILKGDPLWVYFEVYHLSIGSGNKAQYEVEFKLQRLKQRRFRKDKMETVSQKSMFDSETSTTKQSIAFDVKDLEPGSYDFEVEITDKLSGQKKLRAGNFAVIEQK